MVGPSRFVNLFCKALTSLPYYSNGLIRLFHVVIEDREGLRNIENDSRVKNRLVIIPLTVKEN